MKGLKITPRDWGDPFNELRMVLAESSCDKASTLSYAVGGCQRYYRFLQTTWMRLVEDYRQHMESASIVHRFMEHSSHGTAQREPPQAVLEDYISSITYLRLDTETFFIFGTILMDKLAYTASLFIRSRGLKIPATFSRQKRFFQKPENTPFNSDEGYASFIRDKTNWFERSLKLPRDKLIAHGLTYVGGIKSSKDGEITLPKLGWGRDLKEVYEKLIKLKKRYEPKYPELKETLNNIFEITATLLNRPDFSLEPEDEKILMECVKRAGSELPNVSIIADKIIDFTMFFCSHFSELRA